MNTYHYTYLIINNQPTTLEKYYIGVHSGGTNPLTDNYMGSSKYLTRIIADEGADHFDKLIIEQFNNREAAEKHENELHISHSASTNPLFYNKKNGVIGFHVSEESIANLKNTINNPVWQESVGKAMRAKQKETCQSTHWRETVLVEKIKKHKIRKADPEWQATVGKEQVRKDKERKADPEWQATVGRQMRENLIKTRNDPIWKETVEKESLRKIKETKSDPKWVIANTFTCDRCNKTVQGKGNLNRWHNDNCKWT